MAAVVIVAAALAAYGNSFTGLFVFDDEPAIVQNTHIRSLWPLGDAMSAPPETTVSGRPIVSLTLALNYAMAPGDARDVLQAPPAGSPPSAFARFYDNLWGYHAFNLLIHVSTALLLYGVVRRTLQSERLAPTFGRAATGVALAAAVLWTVHPLQTASVTYVVQRAEALMGLFLCLTLYCAIRAWNGERAWAIAAAISCALGMATKESMVATPLIVVLWDWIFAPSARTRDRAPLYGALAASWIVLGIIVAGDYRPNAAGFHFAEWPWWRYLLTQAAVVTHYLRLSIVPAPLVLDYAWPPAKFVQALPQLVFMTTLVALTAWGVVRRQPWAFAAAVFFLVLAPTSSVLPIVTEVAAEHRMYVPLAAVVTLAVTAGYLAVKRWVPASAGRVGALIVVLVVVVFTVQTRARNLDYQDYDRIWRDTIEKRPMNARARNNYATSLVAQRRFAEAEVEARAAVAIDGTSVEARQTLGVALCAQSRCGEGLPHLEAAAALAPGSPDVERNLGEAYAAGGRMADAVTHYRRALAARPDDVMLLNRAGWILATDPDPMLRHGAEAVTLAEHAVTVTGRRDVESLDTLAAALAESGRFEEAIQAGQAAAGLASTTRPEMVPELQARLDGYRARQPFRQPTR